ncbi:MAG TPA: hypothetical protein VFB79_04180 [Candidatus Angelobacter sp.]|nr:hypothetical protein [Candidatus Angelobacter sp.]
MKKLSFLVTAFCLIFILGTAAHAQQFDVSAGVSTVTGPSSNAQVQTISGGAYPNFGVDFVFYKNIGFEFNAAFRAKQNLYQGFQPFRPFFYDFDAVYAPNLGKRAQAELTAGIGAESIRFYTPFLTCGTFTGCTDFVSSNHFLGQFGAGIRFYATNRIFIRPEAHLYVVRNNFEFSGDKVTRFGVSIGYSFKNQE